MPASLAMLASCTFHGAADHDGAIADPDAGSDAALDAPPDAAPDPSLVAAWSLDTSGVDRTMYGNNGTVMGTAVFSPGAHANNALVFDGSTTWVSVPNSTSLDLGGTALTISFWVKLLGADGVDDVLVGKLWMDGAVNVPYYQYGVEFDDSSLNTIDFYFGDAGAGLHGPFSVMPTLGAWTYVAYTYDGTTVRGYLDGVQVLAALESAAIQVRGQSMVFGNDGRLIEPFVGGLDDIRIYSRPLSASEIQHDMVTPIP